MDIRLEVQRAVYLLLQNDATLTGLVGTRVHDFVPDKQVYPFIQVGEATYTEFDTHTFDGFDGTLTIHVWNQSDTVGRAPVHEIQARIYELLHRADLGITDTFTVLSRFEFSEILVEEDQATYHGIQRFRVVIGGKPL